MSKCDGSAADPEQYYSDPGDGIGSHQNVLRDVVHGPAGDSPTNRRTRAAVLRNAVFQCVAVDLQESRIDRSEYAVHISATIVRSLGVEALDRGDRVTEHIIGTIR